MHVKLTNMLAVLQLTNVQALSNIHSTSIRILKKHSVDLVKSKYKKCSRNSCEGIAVRARVGIGYRGVTNSIPPSDLPTLSVVGESEVTISIKHWQGHVWKQPLGYTCTCPLQKEKHCTQAINQSFSFNAQWLLIELIIPSRFYCVFLAFWKFPGRKANVR